jgi:hypothetical protein
MAGRPLRMVLGGDSTGAVKAVANVQSEMGKFTGALAGLPAKGGGAFKGLAAGMSASGIPGQFGELQGLIGHISGAFDTMGEKGKTSFGKITTGVGVAAAGIGAIGLAASKPQADANAKLKQSYENIGESIDDYKDRLAVVVKEEQHSGETKAEVLESQARLVAGLGSGAEAIKYAGTVSDISAARHISLAAAADLVVSIFAGSTRPMKQFGINLTEGTKAGEAAKKNVDEQTKAHDALTKAQQNLADVKARQKDSLATSGGTKDAAALAKVTAAQAALAKAGQHLQTVQASLAGSTKTAAAKALELQAAQNGVTAASKKLDDAQAAGGKTTKLSVSQTIELRKANDEVTEATKKASAADVAALGTKKDLGAGALDFAGKMDLITGKVHGVDDAMADTFGGHMREAKAAIINFAAESGAKYGGMLTAAGPALAGIGGLMQTHLVGKTGEAILSIGSFGTKLAGFSKQVLADGTTMRTGWVANMVGMSTASEASALATATAWGVVLAEFVLIGLAIYLISQNWAEVSLGMKIATQAAANGIMDGIGWILTALAQFSKGIANTLELAEKIPGIGGKFKGMAESARQGEQDLTQWAATLHKGIDITSEDIAKMYPNPTKKIDTKGMDPAWAAIVGATAQPAPGMASTPGVAHYNDQHNVNLLGPVTIKAADLNDLREQLRREGERANFSGDAVATL